MYSNIVLSGGAFKIFALIGALKNIEDKYKNFKKFKNFLGCSAGSLLCLYLSLDYPIDDIFIELKKYYSSSKINNNIKLNNVINFFDNYGLIDSIFIETIVQKICLKKFNKKDISFIEFAKITGKNIIINSSNLTTKKEEFFNVNNHPNMSITTAIKISMCYPFIFKPIKYNDCIYIDGGLYNNFPISYFEANILETIGINLISNETDKIDNFSEYCMAIINSVLDKLTISQIKKEFSDHICNIKIIDSTKCNDFEFFSFKKLEFNIDLTIADIYYKQGHDHFELFFKNLETKHNLLVDKICNSIDTQLSIKS
jgi:NTE family protein